MAPGCGCLAKRKPNTSGLWNQKPHTPTPEPEYSPDWPTDLASDDESEEEEANLAFEDGMRSKAASDVDIDSDVEDEQDKAAKGASEGVTDSNAEACSRGHSEIGYIKYIPAVLSPKGVHKLHFLTSKFRPQLKCRGKNFGGGFLALFETKKTVTFRAAPGPPGLVSALIHTVAQLGLQPVAVFDRSTDRTGGSLPARLGLRASTRTGRVWDGLTRQRGTRSRPFNGFDGSLFVDGNMALEIFYDTLEVLSSSTRQNGRYGRDGWDPLISGPSATL
ncbi:hypothetical protein DFH08DRAFT_817444 [Mycena albidolilacea]|uniref:Uncharacterized protein n=1 Tax=Mycena albidolilacea TaxID=1033008 RepID=A0AAD6ZJI7_9AGAR|nr:hypothetical protein DFH08DRAFT_817444 [Mycena albidolilacea]